MIFGLIYHLLFLNIFHATDFDRCIVAVYFSLLYTLIKMDKLRKKIYYKHIYLFNNLL